MGGLSSGYRWGVVDYAQTPTYKEDVQSATTSVITASSSLRIVLSLAMMAARLSLILLRLDYKASGRYKIFGLFYCVCVYDIASTFFYAVLKPCYV